MGNFLLLMLISMFIDQYKFDQNSNLDIENHPSWDFIDDEEEGCGSSYLDRIVGGTNASPGQYPWIAQLGYSNTRRPQFVCGGSLISKLYVVTAAHCIVGQKLVVVRFGEYDTKKNIDCVQGVCTEPVQDIKPSQIIVHKGFDSKTFHNDIALIRLKREVSYSDWVSPICLPRTVSNVRSKNTVFEVAGWGYMANKKLATVLQTLKVPLVENKRCQLNYNNHKIIKSQICAGGIVNEDSCGGDSGGPLMAVEDRSDGPQYSLEGVVSFGPIDCGIRPIPGVYTDVRFYLKWILDNIQSNEL